MRFRKDDTDILDIVQIILCTIAILAILLTPIFIMVKIKSDSGGESGKPTKRLLIVKTNLQNVVMKC